VAEDLAEPPPGAQSRPDNHPYTHIAPTLTQRAQANDVAALADLINRHERGLIVCGTRCPAGEFAPLAAELAHRTGYPLLADGVSGLRFGTPTALGGYESFLSGNHPFSAPDVVLRFGAVPTSKMLNQYLDQAAPPIVVHVRRSGVWADDSHRVSHFIQADEAAVIRDLLPAITPRQGGWTQTFAAAEVATWQTIEPALAQGAYFDGAAVYDVLDILPSGAVLFVGNSLAVRHLDQFGRPAARHISTYANRGASGIDGNISTALGLGHAHPGAPLVAIVGDITFYHDMNGLLAVQRCGVPITLVVLHNDGGGIFRRLPINAFEPACTDYFVTPHGLDFSHAARMYGLDYVPVQERDAFRQAFSERVSQGGATLIEVRTDAHTDLTRWQEITAAVQGRLQQDITGTS
jgi:2-succinyl-5-enolpyruvyl-6-hydroxy-3-cyclohexene-1-carboxylate synthase